MTPTSIAARAAVLSEVGAPPALHDVQVREPVGDEVLVRVQAVGICHTDISLAARWPDKRMPMVFGHEGAGIVEAVGRTATVRVGTRVVLTFNSCGQCTQCKAGESAYCRQSTALNMRGDRGEVSGSVRGEHGPINGDFFGQSSFATYALAHQRNTVPMGNEIDMSVAAPLGCSVQTGVGSILNALRPVLGQSVVVFGVGAVGLSAVMGARIAGARIIVAVDPVAARRALAIELGATHTVDPAVDEVVSSLVDVTGGGADHVLDTTAIPAVLAEAVAALRSRGQLGIVGLGAPIAALPVGLIMGRGLRIRGIVEGDSAPATFIPELIDLHKRGDLPLEKLITTYDFADFDNAWAAARSGLAIKPVLTL
ncbi:NAD(P)-dependent alcohol dehydrogenase [Gordonia rubripertincta]|uniref:NAD(P)-dependent alcohol dehydrogenase n=1 Tax=Gordonia rubripertincta TaxID=36822 RepID=UPI0035B01E56